MKKWIFILITVIAFAAVLTACAGGATPAVSEASSPLDDMSPKAVIAAVTNNDAALSTAYPGALPVELQLAMGTLQLEDTNLAVTAGQAEDLLPYWRVLQTLAQSSNAADAEINAVVKQIQDSMNGEQVAAIAAMELTEEKLQTMFEEGTINLGFGRGLGGNEEGSGSGLRPGGGPGGGMPGMGPGGGGPGGFGGDPGAFATRQAEIEAGGEEALAVMMERVSSNMVIRLLETKTGEAPQRGSGSFGAVFAVTGELAGLSAKELSQALADGQTLGQILTENGVSLDEAREAMIAAMSDEQLPEGQDLESWIDSFLSGTPGARQPAEDQ